MYFKMGQDISISKQGTGIPRQSFLYTLVQIILKPGLVLYPHQLPYSWSCAKWTLWRAVFAYATSTLSLVLFLWCTSKGWDWSWGKDITPLATEMPSWFDIEHRGEAERGFVISLIRHNFVDSSLERLWYLIVRYKLFCNIYNTNKWQLIMFFLKSF